MGLSFTHMLILGLILLLFFGPRRLPELGKSLGEAIRGFKAGINGEGEKEKKSEQISQRQDSEVTQKINNKTDDKV